MFCAMGAIPGGTGLSTGGTYDCTGGVEASGIGANAPALADDAARLMGSGDEAREDGREDARGAGLEPKSRLKNPRESPAFFLLAVPLAAAPFRPPAEVLGGGACGGGDAARDGGCGFGWDCTWRRDEMRSGRRV